MASIFHPKAKKFIAGRKSLFERLSNQLKTESRKTIWMHCASLGEFEQGRPILEEIRVQYPDYALLLTFFSPSGYEIRQNYEGADYIFYLPIDSKANARKFIQIVQPALALFVKYEFWYHYLKTLHRQGIPTILFSAHFQKNQPFFKPYGALFRRMLSFYNRIFVQDESSKILLTGIGQKNVVVAGDTRFDRMARVLSKPKEFPSILNFKQNKKLIVAGSTWQGDESFLKQAFDLIPDKEYKLLIVPHEVREQNIERILSLFGRDACLWSANGEELKQKNVAVVNSVGQLTFLYQYADVAWVGGGFGKGIHNILEPAVNGIPVFFGPNYQRFREAVEMCRISGANSISEAPIFAEMLSNSDLLSKMGAAAGTYVKANLGATQKIMIYLAEKCFASTS